MRVQCTIHCWVVRWALCDDQRDPCAPQCIEQLRAKHGAELPAVKKIATGELAPLFARSIAPATGHHHMQMRVIVEAAVMSVQHSVAVVLGDAFGQAHIAGGGIGVGMTELFSNAAQVQTGLDEVSGVVVGRSIRSRLNNIPQQIHLVGRALCTRANQSRASFSTRRS